jgi:hypothetical protein
MPGPHLCACPKQPSRSDSLDCFTGVNIWFRPFRNLPTSANPLRANLPELLTYFAYTNVGQSSHTQCDQGMGKSI